MSGTRHVVRLCVNDTWRSVEVEARTSLVDLLRDELLLTGTHVGCEHGVCGCCTVLLEAEPVRACILLAVQVDGSRVTTIEGLCKKDGSLSSVQEAFCAAHALQCGYCTSGMVVAVTALLDASPHPTDAEIEAALGGNVCRCTGYEQIREAVEIASRSSCHTAEVSS